MSQITKRFNALHTTLLPAAQAPTIDLDPALDFRESVIWISAQGLDVPISKALLFAKDEDLPGWTARAFVSQLKLSAAYAEMTPFLTKKFLVNEGLSLLPHLETKLSVSIKLKSALRKKHPPEVFPYITVLRLEGHETIPPAHYPNLFKVSRKRRLDGTFKDYKSKNPCHN